MNANNDQHREVPSKDNDDWRNCKKCGAPPREHEVRNFDRILRLGDVYCIRCGAYVRDFDPT